jgi:hypothetical protein
MPRSIVRYARTVRGKHAAESAPPDLVHALSDPTVEIEREWRLAEVVYEAFERIHVSPRNGRL